MPSCSEAWNERISAWLDGELRGADRRALARHLATCPGCAAAARDFAALRTRLRRAGRAGRAGASGRAAPAAARRRMAVAAAALLAVVAVVAGVRAARAPALEDALAGDLERQHLRTFSRGEPCEFRSSDPAAVAGWLEQTLGYRVAVPDVSGAALLGARRCALDGEPAAHLLYRAGDHALTVFVPRDGTRAERAASAFARSGPRCTEGPLGERVCVVPRAGQPRLAVSDVAAPDLLGLIGR